jgi:hypothetical protein
MDERTVEMLRRRSERGRTADVDILWEAASAEAARRRRRRVRALATVGCTGLVLIVIAVGLAVTAAGDETERVAIAAREPSPAADTPQGWTRLDLSDHRVQLSIPPGWSQVATSTTTDPTTVVSVASSPEFVPACVSPEVNRGTGLTLYEYRDYTPGESFQNPNGGRDLGPEYLFDRPRDFRTLLDQPGGPTTTPVSGGGCATAVSNPFFEYSQFVFRDGDRIFLARIGTVNTAETPPAVSFQLALEVLNTLRVATGTDGTAPPSPSTTTVHTAAPTTVTTPLDATAPAKSADEQEIRDLFATWLGTTSTDDKVRALIEDGESILEAIHAGLAQHTPDDLAKFSGRADTVQLIDADHATVQYTLLYNGQPLYGQRTGAAVKVDGNWQVSRDTECELLALGGITCPPRAQPAPGT